MDRLFFQEVTLPLTEGKQFVVPNTFTWESCFSFFQCNPIIGALLGFIILDIISGILAAISKGKLSSVMSYKGMMGKGMILGMVATARIFEFVLPGIPWGQVMAMFFCVTEAISITENAAACGVPVPKQWTDALAKMKEKREASEKTTLNNTIELHADTATIVHEEHVPGTPSKNKRPSDVVLNLSETPQIVAVKEEKKEKKEDATQTSHETKPSSDTLP